MNHFANNGKEYLKKDRQYRSNQGRTPEQVEVNYKIVGYTFCLLAGSIVLIAILKALGVEL